MTNKLALNVLIKLFFIILLFFPAIALSNDFKIIYPENNEQVHGEVIEVEGTGAVPGAAIEVSVLTNDWYIQDGKAEINKEDGTWTFAPCYLGGKGKFNNHTIKARLIRNGQSIATAKVRGIVRK